jgi:predicted  nucleic acid-binding Zn-ribbon protein
MPRGKKKTALESITEQLEQIDTQIQKEQEKLKDLEAKKKELLDLKKKQELNDLYTQIKASGKSVEDVLLALKK